MLAAGPQRRLLLTAKALVLTAATAATGIAACLIFQAFLPADDAMRTTGRPGRAPRVTGTGLYLTVLGLLGLRARHRLPLQRRSHRGLVRRAVHPHPAGRCCRHRGRTPPAPTCR